MTDMLARADLAALIETARQIVHTAENLLLAGYNTVTATEKADGTLVTVTDRAVDDLITQELTRRFPDHRVLSEERNTVYDPTAEFTWVLDPLDGTTNFARGLPIWGLSLALLYRGQPVLGLLRFLSLREEYLASLDGGATMNGHPIRTSSAARVDEQNFLMVCTRTPRKYRITSPLKLRILGSTAYHLTAVANGSALACVEATPKLWDIAAALLILEEAGGLYHRLDDTIPVFPLKNQPLNYGKISFPLLAAANQLIMVEMEPTIAPI